MGYQYAYMGGSVPQNTGFLHCPRCIDALNPQFMLFILPPDPPPQLVLRPEPYAVDETNFLVTEDDDQYVTMTGDDYITSNPNPADDANTAVLVLNADLSYAGAVTVAYFDLFNGDPANGGTSVLSLITGSATRTNVYGDLEADSSNVLLNSEVITIDTSAGATAGAVAEALTNLTHIGIYNASSGGTLLTSGPLRVTWPTIVEGCVVQFNQLGLAIAQT